MALHDDEVSHESEHHLFSCQHDDVHLAQRENDHDVHVYDHDREREDEHDPLDEHDFLYVLVRLAKQGHLDATFPRMKHFSKDVSCLVSPM